MTRLTFLLILLIFSWVVNKKSTKNYLINILMAKVKVLTYNLGMPTVDCFC